jgi:hypothetical protein
MKLALLPFSLASLVSAAVSSSASSSSWSLSADSELGRALLSQSSRSTGGSRRLDQDYDWETAVAWMSGYSVKFQGCHQIKQWNADADEQNDVRIQTKRLVRFRLCPSEQCSASKAAGCTSGYGDYVVDMDSFVQYYVQGKLQQRQYDCQYHLLKNCDCNKDDHRDDDAFNEDYCQYDCYNDAGLYECIENNPYAAEGGEDQAQRDNFNMENYLQCAQLKVQNNNNNGRDLNQNQVQYFVGPYCTAQGGSVKLGLFSDDTCTEAVSDTTFEALMGFELPYSSDDASLIDATCLSCLEKDDAEKDYESEMADDANNNNNQNGDDASDADQINDMCENLYAMSGKCESSYPSGMLVYEANNNACTYMEGIRIVRQDGIIDTGSTRPSAVATAFIVIFAMAFAAMAFYVWYLRTRLGVKKHTLL